MTGCAEIVLVRHPETQANIDGRFVGRGDTPYTREGLLQLARVPREVARFAPDVVWSSPLKRALQLAERSSIAAGVPLRVDDRLLELDFGAAEGMTFDETLSAGLTLDYRSQDVPVAPGGESRGALQARVVSFFSDIQGVPGTHVIVTHGGVFRSALVQLLGLADDDIWAFHVHNAQIAHVRVIDGHGMLEEFIRG